jgi:TonB family protein
VEILEVPFEQIRTQVLLLHSEQSALDNMSAGFDDRYTVHCATTGTEALTTLGETPIHVIVSAQDLPGMSGVEALKEAKRRSPETVGILLAGSEEKGLEALVGDEEVFQVVQGTISGADLGKLVDNATRQARLMTLAESANDTRAAPEDTGEHIVMETAENGSAIVSESTDSMPVLQPEKPAVAVSTGTQTVDVLVLSKDEAFLATIRESAHGLHDVHSATTLADAEEAVKSGNVGVLVVDAGMVGPNVEKLTVHLRRFAARLVAIVAGRREDGEMLMDLINRGKVYRFLLKPVSPGRARLAIEASSKHHLDAPDSAFKVAAGKADKTAVEAKTKSKPKARKAPSPLKARDASTAPEAKAGKPGKAEKAETPGKAEKAEKADKPGKAEKADRTGKAEKVKAGPANEAEEKDAKAPVDSAQPDLKTTTDKLAPGLADKDSSFTETVTGLVATVTGSLGGKAAGSEEATTAPAANDAKDSGDGSLFSDPKILGIAAAVVIAIGGALFWMMSSGGDAGSDEPRIVDVPVETAPADAADASALPPAMTASVEELVAEARRLRDGGQIYAPAGDNAIERFSAAAAASPRDRDLAGELADVVDQTLAMGESAMLEGRVDDAALAIGQVEAADPQNPRLPFLTAQLGQMQLRDYLDSARVAILDNRYQDADDAIASARALGTAGTTEIDAVQAELDGARSAQRVDDVLATAASRLDAGLLLEPANDNARYYYELALKNDAGNATAIAGLGMIISSLALDARAAIDEGQFDSAEVLLNDARDIDAASEEVVAAAAALEEAKARQAAALEEERRRAAAARKAEAERVAAEERAKAEAEAAAEASAADAVDPDGAATPPEESTGETVAGEPASASPSSDPVAVSSLTRTKYVAPKYPRSAERRSLSGWVDVVFTVGVDGKVGDVEVRGSEPGDVFVASAVRAVEKWEFEPVVENDQNVEKRAGVRMMFAIE